MPAKKKNNRTRVFACVVYPESAPKDFLNIIRDAHVQGFAIYHDRDVDNSTGEIKKPHYHVMIMYEGVKTLDQWHEFRDSFGGVGDEFIQSTRGYARYLCHLDNPEKTKYSPLEVLEFGGACYETSISSGADRYNAIRDMTAFIRQNHIMTYAQLLDYAAENEPSWFTSLCDNSTFVISAYIKSLRYDE